MKKENEENEELPYSTTDKIMKPFEKKYGELVKALTYEMNRNLESNFGYTNTNNIDYAEFNHKSEMAKNLKYKILKYETEQTGGSWRHNWRHKKQPMPNEDEFERLLDSIKPAFKRIGGDVSEAENLIFSIANNYFIKFDYEQKVKRNNKINKISAATHGINEKLIEKLTEIMMQ